MKYPQKFKDSCTTFAEISCIVMNVTLTPNLREIRAEVGRLACEAERSRHTMRSRQPVSAAAKS